MTLDITKIKAGFPGVSPVTAAHLYEAFMVCMNHHMHPQEVALSVNYRVYTLYDYRKVT